MIIRIFLPRLMQRRLRNDILVMGFTRVGGFRMRGFDVACAAALRHKNISLLNHRRSGGEKATRVCARGWKILGPQVRGFWRGREKKERERERET